MYDFWNFYRKNFLTQQIFSILGKKGRPKSFFQEKTFWPLCKLGFRAFAEQVFRKSASSSGKIHTQWNFLLLESNFCRSVIEKIAIFFSILKICDQWSKIFFFFFFFPFFRKMIQSKNQHWHLGCNVRKNFCRSPVDSVCWKKCRDREDLALFRPDSEVVFARNEKLGFYPWGGGRKGQAYMNVHMDFLCSYFEKLHSLNRLRLCMKICSKFFAISKKF